MPILHARRDLSIIVAPQVTPMPVHVEENVDTEGHPVSWGSAVAPYILTNTYSLCSS